MQRFLYAVIMVVATMPMFAAASVSISIGQPGFYGRIDIGGFPPPLLIYPQPVIIQPVPVAPPPIYLHVPPGHARDWRKHCGRYNACGQRVYFVREHWYNEVYVPHYHRHKHKHDDDHGEGHGKSHKGRGHKKD